MTDPLRNLAHDGLHLPRIKEHSLDKIRIHNYFVRTFATAMKAKWAHRAYLGLYAGAGRAQIEKTAEIVETTAISAIRIPDPFTKYIFVDRDSRCTSALEQRIAALAEPPQRTILTGDVNLLLPRIKAAMPSYSKDERLLSFCFVDPFAADLQFATLRALSVYRMDFLVLLMLGVDARLNFRHYFEDSSDNRIALLIDDPEWREDYRRTGDRHVIRYILRRFNDAMVSLEYQSSDVADSYSVRVARKGVFLYSLVFYSKHPLGSSFWRAARSGVNSQLGFGL